MMNFLLIGECYSNNIGDQLVSIVTNYLLHRLYPDCQTTFLDLGGRNKTKELVGTSPGNCGLLFQIRDILSRVNAIDYLLKKRNAISLRGYYIQTIKKKEANLAVFCGGQLVNDTFVCQIEELCKILDKENIPTVFSGVGIGRLNKWQKKKFEKILDRRSVKFISCRSDAERFKTILNINQNVVSSYDPAIFAADVYNRHYNPESNMVGLGVMDSTRFPQKELIRFWIGVIDVLNQRCIKWKMFYTGSYNDYLLATEILREIGINDYSKYIRHDICDPSDLVDELSLFNKILSFRLHSHIVSYSMGIPSVGLLWDPKVVDFFEKIQRPHNVFKIEDNPSYIIDGLMRAESVDIELLSKQKMEVIACFNSFYSFHQD